MLKEAVKFMRDDFPEKVKVLLAKRAGNRCSNPDCRQVTSGPSLSTPGAVNMGVAAHITAASPGGARYDPSLASEERKSYDNGIWLCKYCGDLVDKDDMTYPVDLLRVWKKEAEREAGIEIHRLPQGVQDGVSPSKQQEGRLQQWVADGRKRWAELVEKDLAGENPSRYPHGIWMAAYSLTGNFNPVKLNELQPLLKKVENRHIGFSGWHVWSVSNGDFDLDVYPYHDLVECWMGNNPIWNAAYSFFWRASRDGSMFLLRGYEEDCSPNKVDPGKNLWVHTPIWDVGECLLHAQRLSTALGDESASVSMKFVWEGLLGRTLRYFHNGKGDVTWFDQTYKMCRQETVCNEVLSIPVQGISDNLPDIIKDFTSDLYVKFNFHEVKMTVIQEEVSKMRQQLI